MDTKHWAGGDEGMYWELGEAEGGVNRGKKETHVLLFVILFLVIQTIKKIRRKKNKKVAWRIFT